ncbi:hypothetical protein LIA77_00094 [Sarocladium implicatum]|nr:hypothetical protein LIA77_00094 [Sarocladium implicatum]
MSRPSIAQHKIGNVHLSVTTRNDDDNRDENGLAPWLMRIASGRRERTGALEILAMGGDRMGMGADPAELENQAWVRGWRRIASAITDRRFVCGTFSGGEDWRKAEMGWPREVS